MNKSRTITRVIIMLALAVLFCVLTALVKTNTLSGFESSVYAALSQLSSPGLTTIMTSITDLGSSFSVVAVVLMLLLIPATRKTYGVPAAISSIVGAGAIVVLKDLIERVRPPQDLWLVTESGYSFPSGHALSCTVLFVIILLIVFRKHKELNARLLILVAAIVIPLLVGTSRIYLGVHYAGDVLGGFIIGVLIALLVDTILQRFKAFR